MFGIEEKVKMVGLQSPIVSFFFRIDSDLNVGSYLPHTVS